jgi:hypothetical protein
MFAASEADLEPHATCLGPEQGPGLHGPTVADVDPQAGQELVDEVLLTGAQAMADPSSMDETAAFGRTFGHSNGRPDPAGDIR